MARPPQLGVTGVPDLDDLRNSPSVTLGDYLKGASTYVRESPSLNASQKKVGQILLSQALGRALHRELSHQLPASAMSSSASAWWVALCAA